MAQTELPFDPGPISGLRKRALLKVLERVERTGELRALQVAREPALSSLKASLASELTANRAAVLRLRDRLSEIEAQNALSRKTEEALRRLTPLQRTRLRRGLYRSEQERNAAILGFLERERRQSAPLSREAARRANAIAASRSLYDLKMSYYKKNGVSYGSPQFSKLRGVDVSLSDVDPCVEYRARQKLRREVMFAHRSAGKGYRTSHRWNPC